MSERVSMGDVEDRRLKRKMKEELPALAEKDSNSGSSPKPVDPSSIQAQEENQLSCKFCSRKFRNTQALGGHQNAHKNERILLKMRKEREKNTFWFGPRYVQLYPCAFSHMHPNPMPHMPYTLAPPAGYGTNQQGFSLAPHNFGVPSSWGGGAATTSPWRLNLETLGQWQQIPSPAESAPKSPVGDSSSRVGPGSGDLQGSPSVSTKDSTPKVLDLSLKL